MNEKRKISTRKIVQTLVTLVLLCCCVFGVLSASKIQDTKNLKSVRIEIKNEEYCQFVNKEQIRKAIFENRHLEPTKMTIGKIDLNKMEAILATNPWIENAQVFVDNKKALNINVTQRIPQLRVFDRIGNTYYLDSSMQVLPVSEHYNHYEILFVNVPVIKEDSLGDIFKSRMLSIAQHIKRDTFWLAQTSQIIVNDLNDFQLIPVLGKQKILLGNGSNLGEKLQNIFAFYQNVMKKIGWDWYEIVDARFKNEIVASPSLPWKAPVDRALTNMNWVKTIVGDATKVDNAPKVIVQKPNATNSKDSLKPR